MKRWLKATIFCIPLNTTLAVVALSGMVSWSTTKILLWQMTLLLSVVPHPNIGTAEHPAYEGTPLDLFAAVGGLLLGFPIYALLIYFVLWLISVFQNQKHAFK